MCPKAIFSLLGSDRAPGCSSRPAAAAAAAVPLRSALWMLVCILHVPELAVLDLGEGTSGYVDRATGAWARVAGDRVTAGRAGRLWDAVEGVYARWHDAGEPERPEIGLSIDRGCGQRIWLGSPLGPAWTLG